MSVRRRQPARMFSAREYVHLVAMLAGLGTVIACIVALRRPGSLDWFFSEFKPEISSKAADSVAIVDQIPAAEKPKTQVKAPMDAGRPASECREVDATLLRSIRDRTARENDDREAILQLLCVAKTRTSERLEAESRKDVLFANLFNEPAKYRGQPVQVKGILRRLVRWDLQAKNNSYGISTYYEAWVFPEDQRVNPCLVLCLQPPTGIVPSDELKENVVVDPYFLKLMVYQADDGRSRIAPLLVGAGLRRQPPQSFRGNGVDRVKLGLIALGVFAAVIAGFGWHRLANRSATKDYLATRLARTTSGESPFEQPLDSPVEGSNEKTPAADEVFIKSPPPEL